MGRAGAGHRDVCRPATVCYWVSCLVLSSLFKDTLVILQPFGPQSQSLHSTRGVCFGCSLNIFFNLHMRGAHICVGVGTHIRRLGEDVECLLLSFTFFFKTGSLTELRALISLSKPPGQVSMPDFYMSSGIWTHVLLLSQQAHLTHWAISLGWHLISCTHFKPVIEKMNCEKLVEVFASLR